MTLWDAIIESNTFNFAILLLIFAIVVKKINISSMLENIRFEIEKSINIAKDEQKNADKSLKDAQKSVENLDAEITSRLDESNRKACAIENDILNKCDNQIKSIERNADYTIEAEENVINSRVLKSTISDSVKIAENNIKKLLKDNPGLHDKLIEESIKEI